MKLFRCKGIFDQAVVEISAHQLHLLKYNQVCELVSSKSVSGNVQTLVYASCVVIPIALANLEVKEEDDFGEERRGQQLSHFPLILSICCYGNPRA